MKIFFTGLKVIGSVCDQTATNALGVNLLVDPTSQRVIPDGKLIQYKINDNTISHGWDPPHLIKTMRNNLQKKDLVHYVDKPWSDSYTANDSGTSCDKVNVKRASWSHIEKLYSHDRKLAYPLLKKLTDEHINPSKDKMKVSTACQVFSKSVHDAIVLCTKIGTLEKSFNDTAQAMQFFNDLFDSVNGGGEPQFESLKGSITENSVHFAYWEYAAMQLSKMNFINKSDGSVNNSSSVLRKFEATVRFFMEITKICLNASMEEVSLR